MHVRDWDELLLEVAEMQPPSDVARYVTTRAAAASRGVAPTDAKVFRRGRVVLRLVAVGIGVVVVIAALALAAHSHRSNAPANGESQPPTRTEQPPRRLLQTAVADAVRASRLGHELARHPDASPATTARLQAIREALTSDGTRIQLWRTRSLGEAQARYGTGLQDAIGTYTSALMPRENFTPNAIWTYRSHMRAWTDGGDLVLGMWLSDNPALLRTAPPSPAAAIGETLRDSHIALTRYSTNYAKIGRIGATRIASHQLGTPVIAALHQRCTTPGHAPTDCWVLTLKPRDPPVGTGSILKQRASTRPAVELALVEASTGQIILAVRTTS